MPAPKNPLHRDQPDPADRPATGPTPSPTPEPPSTTEADRATAPPSDGATDSEARRPRTFEPSRLGLLIVAVLVGSALFVGGFTLGARVATTPGTPASQEAQFDPFWDVYSLIQNEYAGSPKPSTDQLVQAAINGMMQSLNDPWSYYQAPSDFESSLLSVGGQAQGIGVEVQLQPIDPNSGTSCSAIGNGCELAVVQPICGSPAAAAGIQAGDVIVSVGGTALDGLTIDQATAMIKGPNDTSVTLGLLRGTTTIQRSVVRMIYNQCEVASKTLANGAVGYISVSGINDPAASQFDLALKNALAAGQRSFILDLRGNGGGYVPDAVKIASEYIPSGTILYQQDASGNQTEIAANPGGLATDPSVKLVVLVDGNTASAAEILAGALQARGRAPLIGTKTYGKGVVQEWLPLPNNDGGIHLTVARWLTPDKVWIQGKGLTPDVAATTVGARAGTDPVLDAGLVALGYPPETTASPSPAPSGSPAPSSAPSPAPSGSPAPGGSPTPGSHTPSPS
jgi:carboxyl-terminal processing protease